jgi:archaetidylinositol phosphate synthase
VNMLKARLKSQDTDWLLHGFASFGCSPMAWTMLSLFAAMAGFLALCLHSLGLGLALFVVSGMLDAVDGAVARATGNATSAGAFADGVADRYAELMLCLGLLLYLGPGELLFLPMDIWFVLLIFGSLMTSFVRAYADHRGLVKDPDELKGMGGLLERGERLALLYLGMLLGIFDPRWLAAAVALTAVLANFTALQRIAIALRRGRR